MPGFTNTKESGLEALIVKYLVEQNGYEERNNADYNKEYAIDESESKPVYAMATAVKDTVTVVLKDVPWEKFLISLFHDENGNWELDMNEQVLHLMSP